VVLGDLLKKLVQLPALILAQRLEELVFDPLRDLAAPRRA
jgi:hypothetical protein